MKKNQQKSFGRVLILALLLLLVACRPEPIVVHITATPVLSELPAATNATLTTPAMTIVTPTPPAPDATLYGPVIGTGYVLPTLPSATPPPTPTTTPGPTGTPVSSPGTPTLSPAPSATNTAGPTNTPDPTRHPVLPNLDANRMGIQIDQERPVEEWVYALDRATALGVTWIKIQVPWLAYQPNGPDQREGGALDSLDDFLLEAQRRNFSVLISVAKAPAWARPTVEENGPPNDPQQLADFLTFLFTRRGGQTVDAVEVWNEPNLQREWRGMPLTGASYMSYFAAAYTAIRDYSSTLPIITAGLAPTGNGDASRNDRDYLQEMYAAGLGNYQNIYIGAHPYSWGNPPEARCCDLSDAGGWDDQPQFFFSDNIDAIRTIMNQNGDANVLIWVTEFGWATWDGFSTPLPAGETWMTEVDRWAQAHYIIRAFAIGQQRSDIGIMILWNMNYATQLNVERSDERAAYAIVTATIRPAYWMIKDAINPNLSYNDYENGE